MIVFSTILCLLGSMVNEEGPATLSTIIRISCRKDKVAESPIYTVQSQWIYSTVTIMERRT